MILLKAPIEMLKLTLEQIQQYLQRSYTAADGLWFMKVEEALGFDAALDMDAKVWEVMPKIQARQLKAFAGADRGLEALRQCMTTKLALDGFRFETRNGQNAFDVQISDCPWHDKMVSAKRGHLSKIIGERICTAEYSIWAREFGCVFRFASEKKICGGKDECLLRFEDHSGVRRSQGSP